ncbi:hypothetical protein ACWGB8_26225 [Kitasatospora sp. NPDC054939]
MGEAPRPDAVLRLVPTHPRAAHPRPAHPLRPLPHPDHPDHPDRPTALSAPGLPSPATARTVPALAVPAQPAAPPTPAPQAVPSQAPPVEPRPLRAQARISFGPAPLDFHRLAAEFPAIQSGLTLVGDADLEIQLACTGPQELRRITTELIRAGAAHVQVELVLRALTREPCPDHRPPGGWEAP